MTRDDIAGWVEDQVILYVDRDVAPSTAAANFMGAPLRRGFHLMNVKRLTSAERDANQARPNQCYKDNSSFSRDALYDLCGVPLLRELIEVHEAPAGFDTLVTLNLAPLDRLNLPNGT